MEYTYEYVPWRGIEKWVMEFYDTKTAVDPSGRPVELGFVHDPDGVKVRGFENKTFRAEGNIAGPGLYGANKFPAGCQKSITIVEGEPDVHAFTQIFGKNYPVVSPKNGASSAKRDCIARRDYLNSFERIYLCLDNDEPGQRASKEIAQLFDFNKVYHVKLSGAKDALEFLETGRADKFKNIWFNSKRYVPESVKSTFDEFDEAIDTAKNDPGVPWPFEKLNNLTGGIKPGRSYLVSGLEGIGKTEFFHRVEAELLQKTEENIAIIHIEEPLDENLKRKAGFVLKQPVHFDDAVASPAEIKAAYRSLFKRSDRVHFYNHFGSDDPDTILDVIRFLVASAGCRYVFLDNLTFIVTGRTGDDERKELDYLSSKLEMMVKELRFSLIMISHENDFEQTRGSRNISKVTDVWINLKRNIKHENPVLRNVIYMTLFKGRGCRGTGPAGALMLNPETHILEELKEEIPVE